MRLLGLGLLFAGALGLSFLIALLLTQDPALAHNERIFNECMKREKTLMEIRGTDGPGLAELNARLACADDLQVRGKTPRGTYDPTVGCDARHRDDRGVWVWTLTPEARAACKAGKPS